MAVCIVKTQYSNICPWNAPQLAEQDLLELQDIPETSPSTEFPLSNAKCFTQNLQLPLTLIQGMPIYTLSGNFFEVFLTISRFTTSNKFWSWICAEIHPDIKGHINSAKVRKARAHVSRTSKSRKLQTEEKLSTNYHLF